MARRRVERAARPPRTGPIRFGTLTADNYRESRGMARGVVRRKDHRSAVAFLRQVFEDDPGGALPEAMQLAERVDILDRKQGARFRSDLVKMLEETEPTLAPIMAAGRIPEGGSTHPGTSLLSPAGSGANTSRSLISRTVSGAKSTAGERAAPDLAEAPDVPAPSSGAAPTAPEEPPKPQATPSQTPLPQAPTQPALPPFLRLSEAEAEAAAAGQALTGLTPDGAAGMTDADLHAALKHLHAKHMAAGTRPSR